MCTQAPEALAPQIADRVRKRPGLPAGVILDGLDEPRPCLAHFCSAVQSLLEAGAVAFSEVGALPSVFSPEELLQAGLIETAPPPATGFRIFGDHFRVDLAQPIGRGSGGVVYRAEQTTLGRTVAVKILRVDPRFAPFGEILTQRFRRESRLIAAVQHPHIVQVIDSGEDGPDLWYAMEFLQGGTLASRIEREGPLPPGAVLETMVALADALRAAAARQILHRDVKPGNVFNAGIKLADFGLARLEGGTAGAPGLTRAGTLVGTLPYMAPERARGERGDLRSDLYSLGATMYQAAAGAMLFDDVDSRDEWIRLHAELTPRAVGDRVPGFPPPLASIIHRCLEKRPEQRYATYEDLLEDLRRAAPALPRLAGRSGTAGRPAAKPSPLVGSFLEGLDMEVLELGSRYERAFGAGCLAIDHDFQEALWALAEKEGLFGLCGRLTGRPLVNFKSALERRLASGREALGSHGSVSLDFRDYIWVAARRAEEQLVDGLFPDTDAIETLLGFLKRFLDGEELRRFRVGKGVRLEPSPAFPSPAPEPAPPPGPYLLKDFLFGPYRILALAGGGGMADVYKACDTRDGGVVALKVLHSHSPKDLGRFRREAGIAARLRHPSIAAVREMGEHAGRHYIAMQFIDGQPLDAESRTLRRNVELVRDAALVLEYAHRQGIVHRDIKPGNLLVDREGRVYLTDFGVSREQGRGASSVFPISETVLGTPEFMAPEQARGDHHHVDARSDVYGLGATLYAVLAGRPPHLHENVGELVMEVITQAPEPLVRHNPRVSPDLEAVVERSMSKDSAARYASAAGFAEDLDRLLREDRCEGGAGSAP